LSIELVIIMKNESRGNIDTKNRQMFWKYSKQSQDLFQLIIAVTNVKNFARASDLSIEIANGKISNRNKKFR
jgi:lipoprotein-releasing system ATP-binding protein